jgi:hypothetical protein
MDYLEIIKILEHHVLDVNATQGSLQNMAIGTAKLVELRLDK